MIRDLAHASIREISALTRSLEEVSGEKFIRMDMGVPGLPAPKIGIQAEIEALQNGFASKYANIDGLPELKSEISKFSKNFLDLEVKPSSCFATVGSMQGSMIAFMIAGRRYGMGQKILFLAPYFPVQHKQAHALGLGSLDIDLGTYRGKKLEEKIEAICNTEDISTIIYSNPNNPAWFCLSEQELESIGKIADKYHIIIIEDLAYFGMDFRKDYSQPGKPPYQPTISKYTTNFIILFSSSKIFSFAGQRVAAMIISDRLAEEHFPKLLDYGSFSRFGTSIVMDGIYILSAGASHTAQYGLFALLKAVNDGSLNLTESAKEYGRRSKIVKQIFLENGFKMVFLKDYNEELADGFFFSVSYPNLSSAQIIEELLKLGMSSVSLSISGITKIEGIRVCVSQLNTASIEELRHKLRTFQNKHSLLKSY